MAMDSSLKKIVPWTQEFYSCNTTQLLGRSQKANRSGTQVALNKVGWKASVQTAFQWKIGFFTKPNFVQIVFVGNFSRRINNPNCSEWWGRHYEQYSAINKRAGIEITTQVCSAHIDLWLAGEQLDPASTAAKSFRFLSKLWWIRVIRGTDWSSLPGLNVTEEALMEKTTFHTHIQFCTQWQWGDKGSQSDKLLNMYIFSIDEESTSSP